VLTRDYLGVGAVVGEALSSRLKLRVSGIKDSTRIIPPTLYFRGNCRSPTLSGRPSPRVAGQGLDK
jgi:hypothetical protein